MRARSFGIGAALLIAAACGATQRGGYGSSGLPPEKAKTQCEQIKQSEEHCWNDQVGDQCVACLTQCGFSCGQAESCPLQFHCPP